MLEVTWNGCIDGELNELLRLAHEIVIFENSPVVVVKCSFLGEWELMADLARTVREAADDPMFLRKWHSLQPHKGRSGSGVLIRVGEPSPEPPIKVGTVEWYRRVYS